MMKLEPASKEMKEMSIDDIFLSHLKLIIIIAKAFLKNYPIGKYKKSAVIENVHHVFYHSLQMINQINFSENNGSESHPAVTSKLDTEEECTFYRKVQLLAVMVKAVAENRLIDNIRKNALQENLDRICDTLIFKFHIKDFDFLKIT